MIISTSELEWDKRFLNIAKEVSTWSKDPTTKVGAVLVDPKTRNILSTGYNGFPSKFSDNTEILNDRLLKRRITIHAEINAILNAAKLGISTNNSTLYVYGLPVCDYCAPNIIQAGIKRVLMEKNHSILIDPKWDIAWEFSSWLFDKSYVHASFIFPTEE